MTPVDEYMECERSGNRFRLLKTGGTLEIYVGPKPMPAYLPDASRVAAPPGTSAADFTKMCGGFVHLWRLARCWPC